MRQLSQVLIAILLLSLGNLSYAQCDGVVPLLCDADGDGAVDSDDIAAIGAANGESVEPGDIRDIDADGVITGLDARQCVARCDEEGCATVSAESGPLITINSPIDGDTITTPTVMVEGTATDEDGIAGIQINGSEASRLGDSFTLQIGLVEGVNLIHVLAVDQKGNESSKTLTLTYTPQVIGRIIEYDGPPPFDASVLDGLPTDIETGLPVLIESSGVKIAVDLEQNDPIAGFARCTDWITSCVSRADDRLLDDCARSVPRCISEEPWLETEVCCPEACFARYSDMRREGLDPIAAFGEVYLEDGSCYPKYLDPLD